MAKHPNPNQSVADGLRLAADWFDMHPELPEARFACVSLRAINDGQPPRDTLELIARALGDRAEEKRDVSGNVEIGASFWRCRVIATATIDELADRAPAQQPAYEPIIVKRNAFSVVAA